MQTGGERLPRGSELGGYRIDELIGHGGMGVVYRVTNVALNRIYALKLLIPALAEDEQFRQRFQREMRIAASIHHPHVVGIHYAGQQDGFLFLAMDYVHGTDLRETLRKEGALHLERAVELVTQVASALDAAHTRGLVHRDVKPANILITIEDAEEHAYLTDFGLAKRSDSLSGLTVQGNVVGTVDYMAPEQVTGERTDARSDIYALGCVFFRMITGKVPYERDTSVATLFAHVHEPPPTLDSPLADEYPEFGPVLERAMAKKPDDRYLSAGDFARDAAAAMRGGRYTHDQSMVATGEARPTSGVRAGPEQANAAPSVPGAASETTKAQRHAAAPGLGASTEVHAEQPPGPEPGRKQGGGGPLRRYGWPALGLLLVAAAAAAALIGFTSGSSTTNTQQFEAILRPVPTNHVTGSGTAAVRLSGNEATVTIDATGLINGSHQMHIHALGAGLCPPRAAAHRYNGHLAVSTTDGLQYFGPMAAALTLTGDTSPNSMLAFSRYPSTGIIHYQRTMTITRTAANAIRNGNAVIVVHGIDYNRNGIYDNVLNRSELENGVPQEETAPALCGTVLNPRSVGLSG